MTPDALPSKPRRRIHWMRWLFVLGVVLTAWGGCRQYDFHRAEEEAEALGWDWQYENPFDTIRDDWRAAFREATWRGSRRALWIQDGETYLPNHRIVRRLQPRVLGIYSAPALRDLDTLRGLTSLQTLDLGECTGLTSVDGLRDLTSLRRLYVFHCAALTSVDGLRGLTSLQEIYLPDCTGLTSVDALHGLTSLQVLSFLGCTGLTSVDGLHGLTSLQYLGLGGCTGLSGDAVAALRAALPGCGISEP